MQSFRTVACSLLSARDNDNDRNDLPGFSATASRHDQVFNTQLSVIIVRSKIPSDLFPLFPDSDLAEALRYIYDCAPPTGQYSTRSRNYRTELFDLQRKIWKSVLFTKISVEKIDSHQGNDKIAIIAYGEPFTGQTYRLGEICACNQPFYLDFLFNKIYVITAFLLHACLFSNEERLLL